MENVFVLISPHTDEDEVKKYLDKIDLGHLKIWNEPNLPPFINPLETIVILLLSGGTELMVKKIVEKAFSNIYINCVPINNAISAGAELNGYYHGNSEIKISSFSEETFQLLFNIEKYKDNIDHSRLVIIGKPHEWVLTSEFLSPPSPFQTRFTPVKQLELLAIRDKIDTRLANETAEYWIEQKETEHLPPAEFYTAAINYLAIKKVLEKYSSNMVALRCKELQQKGSSLCLAMDRLNDEGIVAACEGDLEAAFSLKIIKELTGKTGWMTNISHIDFNDNLLYLSHCTIPVDMFKFNSSYLFHNTPDYDFIEEFMDIRQPQEVTIFRIGKDQRFDVLEGTVDSEIIGKFNFCRSTLQVQANTSLFEWFENICGNHQIIVYGKYADLIRHFFEILYA